MRRRRRLILAIPVLAVALGAGLFWWKQFGASEALAIGQLSALGDSAEGHWVQVRGRVEGTSIVWDAQARQVRFVLSDGANRLAVVYPGTLPDSFKPGAEVVVEGRHRAGGPFEAYGFVNRSWCSLCHG